MTWQNVIIAAALPLISVSVYALWVFIEAHNRLPDGSGELINWWLRLP